MAQSKAHDVPSRVGNADPVTDGAFDFPIKSASADAAMKESEERLQAIIANLSEGLVVSDLDGQLLHWNPAALAMHGFTDNAEWCRRLPEFQTIFELATLDGAIVPFEQWPVPRLLRGESLRECELRIRRLAGDWQRIFSYTGSIVRDAGGHPLVFLTMRDVTARRRAEALLRGQNRVLDMVARGEPLAQTLHALLVLLEAEAGDLFCSILLLDETGRRLRHGAAPRLPAEYCEAIDGAPIGPCAGSCGTAAYRGEAVLVTDIASDPLWADYKHLALPHGLKACWSTPIFDPGRKVLGTFAIYHRETGQPNSRHRELIALATHTAAIAIGRQRTESALRASEARATAVLNSLSSHIAVVDRDGVVVAVNESWRRFAWENLAGDSPAVQPGVNYLDVVRRAAATDGQARQALEGIQTVLRGERERFELEYPCDAPRQERRFRMIVTSLQGGVGAVLAHEDVTARVLAQEALRDSAEFNRQIVESADDGIVVLDRELRYIVWNHFMEELMGMPAGEVLGRHPEELFPWVRRGGQLAAMRRALSGEEIVVPNSMRIRTRSNRLCWVQARLSALRNAPGEIVGVIVTIVDVTERKEAEESLRRSHEQMRALAARLQSVREEQSAHIAREIHDVLGQQLTAMKLDLAWMKRRVAALTEPELRAALADKLGVTTGLVDATIHTVQKVATELRPGLLDKLGLAAALAHEVRDFAQRTGLDCDMDFPADKLALTKEQEIGLFRVCQEMLTNVARHAQARKVRVRLAREPAQLVLEVQDDGRGIEETQLNGARSLGLLGMKERAQLLGGSLVITGAAGRGTRARLLIPSEGVS